MILAAGYGKRFQPHSLYLAKPALPLFDVPIIAHSIHYLSLMGAEEFIINTHHLPQTVERAIQSLNLSQKIHWSREPEILGSGGGIKNAENLLDQEEFFLVANADCVLSIPHRDILSKLIDCHKKNRALATLLSCPHTGLGTIYGALWCHKNRIKSIGKNNSQLKAQHYASLMILSQDIFSYLPENTSCLFSDSVSPAIKEGALVQSFYVEDMYWFETGNLTSYLNAQRDLLTHMNKSHPYSGFVRSTYQRFLDYDLTITPRLQWISPHATVDATSTVGDNVVICSGAQVGKNIYLDNSVISWHSSIERTVHSEMMLQT